MKQKPYESVSDDYLDSCHYIWQAIQLLSPNFAKEMWINSVTLLPNNDGSYSFNAKIMKEPPK